MPIHIMVGVLIDDVGRALIAQRAAGKQHAGGWEFPGGKLEPGEDRRIGLARELREELGISIESPRPLIRVAHTYSYGQVLLDVWVVRRFIGIPRGMDGQTLRWCPRRDLAAASLLPADEPIVAALRLPECLKEAVTDDYAVAEFRSVAHRHDPDRLHGALCSSSIDARAAVRGGADFVVLRELLPRTELEELCASVDVPIYAVGLELATAWSCGAGGINQLGL